MRVMDYLEAKYRCIRPTTMLAVEARAFGIPYPLPSGWIEAYAQAEITPDIARRLRDLLTRSQRPTAKDGLAVLDKAWLELKGMPDASSRAFLSSKAWKRVRLQALNLHGRACQICGCGAQQGAVLNVDHIKPRALFPELALRLDNLQVLCGDCNEGKGNWDMTDARPP